MPIVLDHTIVPSKDKVAAAQFFAEIFGVPYDGVSGPFAQVRVNDALTFDFADREGFEAHHYAFYIGDDDFDAILGRVQAAGRTYGSGPSTPENGQINIRRGGRGFYFKDLDGHLLEVMTRPER